MIEKVSLREYHTTTQLYDIALEDQLVVGLCALEEDHTCVESIAG